MQTYFYFGVCPTWDFDHHVEQGLFDIGIQGNVVEWRNNLTVRLWIDDRSMC